MDIQRKAFEESNNVNPDWSFKFDEELQQYVAVDFEMTNQVDEFNEHWDTFRAGWDAKAQAVPEGFVLVPKEPNEEQWGGFARLLGRYMQSHSRYCPSNLKKYIEHFESIPSWLNREVTNWESDHAFATADLPVFIYKAMIEAQEQKVTEMKINWGMECPRCNHNEAIIHSTAEKDSGYEFMNGDAVNCLKCGNTGEMDANSEDSDIVWNEYEAQEQSYD